MIRLGSRSPHLHNHRLVLGPDLETIGAGRQTRENDISMTQEEEK